ncbi:MAG: 2-dehydropantoate 2-reductase [Micromonosporaceae bacterium]|nr:2-dehydropantoate 2-reductase [Micromonosporaceae bacterium]
MVVGAGAVGGVVGARLAAAGREVVLVARGEHLAAIRRDGLRLRTPEGESGLRVPAVGSVSEVDWRPGDVALLAVKSMDTAAVLAELAAYADPETTVACLQNAVANEPAALRYFARVYGICVMLPASHLEPGVVVQNCAPVPGILDLGRYPSGVDSRGEQLAADLRRAGFESQPRPDIIRWKYNKLLMNLGNAVEALCGRVEGVDDAARLLRAEGESVLEAAGIAYVSQAEDRTRRGDLLQLRPVAGVPRAGGSTWQSLARGTGSVEADYLNGEIVWLARLHGVPAPGNELVRRLVLRYAREQRPPGSMAVAQLLAALRMAGLRVNA